MSAPRGNWSRILVWTGVASLILIGLLYLKDAQRRETERLHPMLKTIRETQENQEREPYKIMVPTQQTNKVNVRSAELDDAQKAELARKFNEKFRPAVERWLSAYEGRVPFGIEDFTLDKFHSTLGSHMFTFMINPDLTLTLLESRDPKGEAKVGYLMSRKAAVEMNSIPKHGDGSVPDLNPSVTRDDVAKMVKLDSGVSFTPNEILIRPTGKSTALNGGTFVNILPLGADPNNFMNYKISMVFDSNGTLVNYERDPRF